MTSDSEFREFRRQRTGPSRHPGWHEPQPAQYMRGKKPSRQTTPRTALGETALPVRRIASRWDGNQPVGGTRLTEDRIERTPPDHASHRPTVTVSIVASDVDAAQGKQVPFDLARGARVSGIPGL